MVEYTNEEAARYYELKMSRLRKRCSRCMCIRCNDAEPYMYCARCKKYTQTHDEFQENNLNELRLDTPV